MAASAGWTLRNSHIPSMPCLEHWPANRQVQGSGFDRDEGDRMLRAKQTVSVAVVGLCAGLALPGAAQAAAFKCQNGFQIVKGNAIATPYCQEKQLYEVSREYGIRTSFAEIRNNPLRKRLICAVIGRDIRVQETCVDANVGGRRGF
jgi:hypothetical protein